MSPSGYYLTELGEASSQAVISGPRLGRSIRESVHLLVPARHQVAEQVSRHLVLVAVGAEDQPPARLDEHFEQPIHEVFQPRWRHLVLDGRDVREPSRRRPFHHRTGPDAVRHAWVKYPSQVSDLRQ